MFRRRRRKILWDEHAEREVLRYVDRYPGLYDAIRSLEWLLEHDPANSQADRIRDKYWLIKSNRASGIGDAGLPEILLIYHFDEKSVTFWDMRIEP
ncbi:MAG: hypothetical protein BMS9Abin05_0992 [Rhodothermia bacterium]|nr:MAG: hypothetical protein BMS9Abin05_0992 [Rhodothermia bacterium]